MADFLTDFREREAQLKKATERLEDYLKFVLKEERVLFHAVSGRVKSQKSVKVKFLKKKYQNPWSDMTDLVALRVFTYFRNDASVVEMALRKHFVIDEKNSLNKAEDLNFMEFGYTSRHLIMSTCDATGDLILKRDLGQLKFEVQIRSVLEHGWAEVEHELVYKAGTKAPDPIRRRFAASAAALELIEREFAQLRIFETDLIEERIKNLEFFVPYAQIDRAWFIAVLCSAFPNRKTWSSVPKEDNFYHGLELGLLEFLKASGIENVAQWYAAVTDARVVSVVTKYALELGLETTEINHLPIAIIACAQVGDIADYTEITDTALAEAIKPVGPEP